MSTVPSGSTNEGTPQISCVLLDSGLSQGIFNLFVVLQINERTSIWALFFLIKGLFWLAKLSSSCKRYKECTLVIGYLEIKYYINAILQRKIYLFIRRIINQNKMQGKLVFIHMKEDKIQTPVFTKSIQLSVRKRSFKGVSQTQSQNQNENKVISKKSKSNNRKLRRPLGNCSNQIEQSNRRLFNDIKNIQSIQTLLGQKEHNNNNANQANPRLNTQEISNAISCYPTFFPENLNIESKRRYGEHQNQESIQPIYQRSIASRVQRFSNSENCFYSITQKKTDLSVNKKGRLIRGIQSAKRNRSFTNSRNPNNNQPVSSQKTTLLDFPENRVHIKPRIQQHRSKSSSAALANSNSILQDFLRSEKQKQSLHEYYIEQKQKKLRKMGYAQNINVNPRRMSASRALQYFSQVFKREDIQRVKIRKGSVGQSEDISAKKVILQERVQNREQSKDSKFKRHSSTAKQDKQNIELDSDIEKGLSWKKKKVRGSSKPNIDQNFDIIGWQVPEMM